MRTIELALVTYHAKLELSSLQYKYLKALVYLIIMH